MTALAVAQPIFDLLARNPELLWLREVSGLRLWAFGFGLFLCIPGLMILLAELAGRVHLAFRLFMYRLWLWFGLWLLALVVIRRPAADLGAVAVFAAAGLTATVGIWMHARSRWARELGTLLSMLVWVVPLLFVLRPEVRARRTTPTLERVSAASGQPPPIVLVVFDELPVATLMTTSGEIDRGWFPGFGRLASTSTWFRDVLTTSTMTLQAMPALLSGRVVGASDQGAALNDQRTVFRLVEATHERFAYSAVAGIVPREVALLGGDGKARGSWMEDLWILYLHLTMPTEIRGRLPQVSAAWGEFGSRENEGTSLRQAIAAVQHSGSEGARPLFAYLHSSLPHHPWTYLPSGSRYWGDDHLVAPGFSGISDIGSWTTDPWFVAQAYQRHLLQAMYADRSLTELIDRLMEVDLWQSALVVVTADHGVSFAPGLPLRIPTDSTLAEVAAVPLFVKLPGQTESKVSDRPASVLDILPTIADAYGQAVPWSVDGISLLREDWEPERERSVAHPTAGPVGVTRGLFNEILTVARARRYLFGRSETGARDPFRIGPYSGLVGRPLADVEINPFGETWSADVVEHDQDDRLVPARLRIVFEPLDDLKRPTAFAVVVDQQIVATTVVVPAAEPTLSVLIPDEVAARAAESVRLFRIVVSPQEQPRFEEVLLSRQSYRISPDGAWIVAGDGKRWKLDPRAFRGAVHALNLPDPKGRSRLLAWGVDDQDRAPERLVVLSGGRSITWARAGVPEGDFLDYLRFAVPEERIFYLTLPEIDTAERYFVLGADGRAGELSLSSESRDAPLPPGLETDDTPL